MLRCKHGQHRVAQSKNLPLLTFRSYFSPSAGFRLSVSVVGKASQSARPPPRSGGRPYRRHAGPRAARRKTPWRPCSIRAETWVVRNSVWLSAPELQDPVASVGRTPVTVVSPEEAALRHILDPRCIPIASGRMPTEAYPREVRITRGKIGSALSATSDVPGSRRPICLIGGLPTNSATKRFAGRS